MDHCRTAASPSAKGTLLSLALGLTLCLFIPADAFALGQNISPMGGVMCSIIDFIYGNFGRALATLAVISLGVGAMMGKVSWGLALTVAGGISVVFGAPFITKYLLVAAGQGGWIGCEATGG